MRQIVQWLPVTSFNYSPKHAAFIMYPSLEETLMTECKKVRCIVSDSGKYDGYSYGVIDTFKACDELVLRAGPQFYIVTLNRSWTGVPDMAGKYVLEIV